MRLVPSDMASGGHGQLIDIVRVLNNHDATLKEINKRRSNMEQEARALNRRYRESMQ